ncbi:MAG: hypothetical protein U1E60_00665 [Reyranellaceae bacterium]
MPVEPTSVIVSVPAVQVVKVHADMSNVAPDCALTTIAVEGRAGDRQRRRDQARAELLAERRRRRPRRVHERDLLDVEARDTVRRRRAQIDRRARRRRPDLQVLSWRCHRTCRRQTPGWCWVDHIGLVVAEPVIVSLPVDLVTVIVSVLDVHVA